jgi:hypothetical protein
VGCKRDHLKCKLPLELSLEKLVMASCVVEARVYLTVGNRPGYRGNRPGPVTVLAGYQPVGSKFFEFEFQKLKNVEKISKNTS